MQTKEERNKKRAQTRFEKGYMMEQSRNGMVVNMFRRAIKEHWSHRKMLDYRTEWIYRGKLPAWIHQRLMGAWDAVQSNMRRDGVLTFCYKHPITGVITPSTILCNQGLASQIETGTGEHYYRNDDGTYTDAF